MAGAGVLRGPCAGTATFGGLTGVLLGPHAHGDAGAAPAEFGRFDYSPAEGPVSVTVTDGAGQGFGPAKSRSSTQSSAVRIAPRATASSPRTEAASRV